MTVEEIYCKLDLKGYAKFIYFILRGDVIKIGISNMPFRRMRQLQTACPELLEMLLVIPGGREDEKYLHDLFAPVCVGGEWFKDCPPLRNYIAGERVRVEEFLNRPSLIEWLLADAQAELEANTRNKRADDSEGEADKVM